MHPSPSVIGAICVCDAVPWPLRLRYECVGSMTTSGLGVDTRSPMVHRDPRRRPSRREGGVMSKSTSIHHLLEDIETDLNTARVWLWEGAGCGVLR